MATTSKKKKTVEVAANGQPKSAGRAKVLKTYKIYIGGKFPRTESGRYYSPTNAAGEALGNICLSSRKDLRNAVVAARGAFEGWAGRTAYNRSQILYRMAEMLETRAAQFVEELIVQGSSKVKAQDEVQIATDRLVHYAGWCDKYQQIFSAVNPVASAHFNFSVVEPTGVVGVMLPEEGALLGPVSALAPAIAGGNTCVLLASESKPLCSVTFSELMATSDLPGGVVNILTGSRKELAEHFVGHKDINALVVYDADTDQKVALQQASADNLKRMVFRSSVELGSEKAETPYHIKDTQEVKTTWHPIEVVGSKGKGY